MVGARLVLNTYSTYSSGVRERPLTRRIIGRAGYVVAKQGEFGGIVRGASKWSLSVYLLVDSAECILNGCAGHVFAMRTRSGCV